MTCPRSCRVDRIAGERGVCGIGALAQVASYGPHFGEEAPLVGRGGSGTIFFAGCNLGCVFCQNYDISQPLRDHPEWEATAEEIARMMLGLQSMGCENINFVSPSHVVPQILAALVVAAGEGLRLPLVYNSGGYDALHTLRLLDGVVDIYMPDMKYSDDRVGQPLSGVRDYVARNRAAVLEMHRQVGDLELDERGVARRGLLVRHLVLPDGLAGTADVARFLADEVSRNTYINVMNQYRPAHKAARRGGLALWSRVAESCGEVGAVEVGGAADGDGTVGAGPEGDARPTRATTRSTRATDGRLVPDCEQIVRPPTVAEYRAAVREVLDAGLWRLDR
jgi:putative pyruvate formate lyase activating enzyme